MFVLAVESSFSVFLAVSLHLSGCGILIYTVAGKLLGAKALILPKMLVVPIWRFKV